MSFAPGIYPDVDEEDYHARRFGPEESLSSTEASRVLTAPALFQWERANVRPHNPAFDLGHVAHSLVLGVGLNIYVHDHESLRTKAARDDVAAHRERGEVVVSRTEYETMQALADAVLTHPVAGPLLAMGMPEQSVYARDEVTDTWMRGRLDWLTMRRGKPLIVDLKTTASANLRDFSRSIRSYGYDLQREWYRTIYRQITGDEADFIHVVVEKTPPHLVSVIRLGDEWASRGRAKVRAALDAYATCRDADSWPGYTSGIVTLEP